MGVGSSVALRLLVDADLEAPHVPEKVLVAAVLEMAFRDLECDIPILYKQAIRWFLYQKKRTRKTSYFYFKDCCEYLDLSDWQIKFLIDRATEKEFKTYRKEKVVGPRTGPSNVPAHPIHPAYSAFKKRIRVVRY